MCIVVAMVLVAFTGLTYGYNAGVGASPDLGTRGEDRRLLSAFDELAKLQTPEEAEQFALADTSGPASIFDSDSIEILSPDGAFARPVTTDEMRDAMRETAVRLAQSRDGSVTVKVADPQTGTRGHLVGGEIDAGGPYGGPTTFEGGPALTFQVQVFDPTIIFFRWDFNNDGIYDFPDQTGAPLTGRWTTSTIVTKQFLDNYLGDIVVQGWDGVSTIIQFNSGDTLGQPTSFQWFIGFGGWNFAWQFRAKKNFVVTELGHYHYVYNLFDMGLWDTSGNLLGSCMATHTAFQWNWCTLPTTVNIVQGSEYRLSIRIETWMTGLNTPADTDYVQRQGTYYCFSPSVLCFPNTFWTATFIPHTDFRWRETLILPDAARDTATLEIHNVAPSVSNIMTNPSPAQEGTPAEFTARFSDPGLDDEWEYRWIFHDGEVSPWRKVSKFSGGAKVLVLHSWTGDVNNFLPNIAAACGNFCVKIDELDFGPLGQNRIPTLDELRQYDVLLMGTNWGPIPNANAVGDRLAEYMDDAGSRGGGIVMMFAGFYTTNTWGIGGRWQSDGYAPIDRVGFQFSVSGLGTIYVPGHPILDGVSSMTSFYRHTAFSVKAGATRVADFTTGHVLAATQTNPIVPNGATAVALPWFPLNSGGDYWRMIANAIKFASRQPDPVLKTMPITLDVLKKIYKDDHPTTTTPVDSFPVRVEVRDDDHDRLAIVSQTPLFFNNFESTSQCNGFWGSPSTWPPGWSAQPNGMGWVCNYDGTFGSRAPGIWYWYNDPLYGTGDGNSYLRTNMYDMSSFVGVRLEFNTYWQGNYPFGNSNGFVQASVNGGATFPITLHAFFHNNPGTYRGPVSIESIAVGGFSNVQFRFYYQSADDWWWFVDDVRVTGLVGTVMQGLGTADGVASVANVPPTVVGGFDSALRNEAQRLEFRGFEITDPALVEPTEWFAYAWDFDDGTPVQWVNKGTLAPPKSKILVVHTLCLALVQSSSCPDYTNLRNQLLSLDTVASVDEHNFINYPSTPIAPTLSTMLQYDVIVVATNWAYFSFAPFDLARRQVGDRLAQYLEAGRGGVLTYMAVYDISAGAGDIFSILGKYIDADYGPFEKETYVFQPQTTLGTRYDPEHDLFVKVGPNVGSQFISPGDMRTTVGGTDLAAGQNGVLLADWPNGNSAIGVKTLTNGKRTAHFGAFGNPTGSDTPQLVRNAIGWVAGGIPSPKIAPFSHTYADNGVYTVDLMVIDDDMGFVWDAAANRPRQVLTGPGTGMAHRFVTVAVDNVDPTIMPGSIEAFIATQACVRVTGQEGNSVTGRFFVDGVLAAEVTTVRASGNPNVPTEKCGLMKVDVLAPHSYSATLTYSAPNGGSNPTWLILMPWREPVSPGHGTVTMKYDFTSSGQTVTQPLPTLKRDLLAAGKGAKIDFVAEAFDPGSDDLAFLWVWGTVAGTPYSVPNLANAVYTIHVYHNGGLARSDGTLAGPQFLGFSEPYFDRAMNTGRSPGGTMNWAVRDTAVHAFDLQQPLYYVVLIVLDDDNTRGYPSTFLNDGIDMEFILVDLR